MVGIIFSPVSNMQSVYRVLSKMQQPCRVIERREDLSAVTHLVFPGVGNFTKAIDVINTNGLRQSLEECVLEKSIPFLGICLGMQILGNTSGESSSSTGLGWLNFQSVGLADQSVRIPHIGWNTVQADPQSILLNTLHPTDEFFFMHSYHVVAPDSIAKGFTVYGQEKFVSVVEKHPVYGVQFHPEKSYRAGVKLFNNFFSI